jgi:hypothetical protein
VPTVPFKISGGASHATKSSQVVRFTLVPAASGVRAPEPVLPDGGFAATLINLRESLLRASSQKPCFTFPDDAKNSIEFGFSVTNASNAGGSISFLIFSLGADRKDSFQAANTVTVNFKAKGEALLVP